MNTKHHESLEEEFAAICEASARPPEDEGARIEFLAAKFVVAEVREKQSLPPAFARIAQKSGVLGFLENLIGPDDRKMLMSLVESGDAANRAIAYHCLRRMSGDDWQSQLRTAFEKEADVNNKMHIIYTLIHFEGEPLTLRFVEYVNQNEAEVLVREIAYFGGDPKRVVQHALRRLNDQEYLPKRFLYIKNLGLLGDESALPPLQKFRADNENYVVEAATQAIRRIQSRQPRG